MEISYFVEQAKSNALAQVLRRLVEESEGTISARESIEAVRENSEAFGFSHHAQQLLGELIAELRGEGGQRRISWGGKWQLRFFLLWAAVDPFEPGILDWIVFLRMRSIIII